ncbi:MAG: enoyl-CoA hydratase/isomerase family protein [Myxococcota bacterium]
MAELACPSVALVSGSGGPKPLDPRAFDLVLSSARELEKVEAAVRRRPLATAALVQLLRYGAGLPLNAALLAESAVYSTLQGGPEFGGWLAQNKPRGGGEEDKERLVLIDRDGELLRLELNRPRRHNAFSAAMRDALCEALELAVTDTSIRRIVLKGRGPSFCSGGELAEFGTLPDTATAHLVRCTRNAARLFDRCAERMRVELHGACVGAGVELPAFASRIIANGDAYFQLPELEMGLVPGAGGTVSIPRRVGRQRAAYMALSGDRVDAGRALEWGLVDEVRD